MKISNKEITTLVFLLFCNIALMAQVKKHKSLISPNNSQQTPITKHKRDTSYKRNLLKDVKSKKIVMGISCSPNATVFLQNIMHKVNILTTNNNKVTLVTTVYYQGESTLTDGQWFSKLKLGLTGNENNIEVTSGDFSKRSTQGNMRIKAAPMLDTIFNGVTVFDSLGNAMGRRSSSDRNIILYVPAGVKMDIDSKYADVAFDNNMGKVKASINNGGLTLMNADQLLLTSVYGYIYAGNVRHAEIDITNGKLRAKNIDTLYITSKNSSVALDKIALLNIRNSQADQFEIEEAQSITGHKAYGDLRLTILNGSVDLSGVNSDVKIKNINPSVRTIKIKTQYADLGLPVRNLKNYTVAFEGIGGNVHTPFEKTSVTDVSFKTSVGNSNEKPTVFELSCQHCSIDFK